MTTFPTLLKSYRERAGLSQSKLAEASGFDHSYISRLESDARNPSRDAVATLSEKLHLSDDERDALMRSAGYLLPESPIERAAQTIPELRDLAEMLIDERVSRSYRGSVRMLMSACVQQAAVSKEVAA